MPETLTLPANASGLAQAAQLLHAGACVAFPTETVYGLGADATNGKAIADIFAAKGRPRFNPLIVHVADAIAAQALAEWSDTADALAQAFWPGPLTLVLPCKPGGPLSDLVTAGLPSVALRVPDHPISQQLLSQAGLPIAAPSANPSGSISPTESKHVLAGLNGVIAAVVDGGPCPVGLESTIIGLADGTPRLLRAGGLPAEVIEAALGMPLAAATDQISAPGQLSSHYAPDAPVRLEAVAPRPGEVFLGFGNMQADLNLSPSGDLREAAANLFGHLHRLNALGQPIAVASVPKTGLGRAINDRLARAAAPRSQAVPASADKSAGSMPS